MKSTLMVVLSGLLFGAGLAVAGMTEPTRVLGFLDLFGTWDPILAFVMGGGVAVTMPGFALLMRQPRPWHALRFDWPTRRDIDPRLVGGSALFGLGWGLAGFCPGPAIAGLVTGSMAVVAFVLAMLAGMMAHDRWLRA
ncbi:DUF6691 family protein, partial [Polycyclovorans algicola]|uniref:DUF6691 family protein n=1 Tax=Polycyclovorans algicola TaxID=616992 RepID=UPI0004A6ACA2